jgi:hypothetical protein
MCHSEGRIAVESSWLIELVKTVGVPVATLATLCYAIWMVLIWVGREVVIPVRDKLLTKGATVLDRMDSSIQSLQSLMENMSEKIERSLAGLERIEAGDRTLPQRTAEECRLARSSAVKTHSIDAALGAPAPRPKENP